MAYPYNLLRPTQLVTVTELTNDKAPGLNNVAYVKSTSGEDLGRDVNVRHSERKVRRSERIRNFPQRFNPGFGSAREWNNDAVASIVYLTNTTLFRSSR